MATSPKISDRAPELNTAAPKAPVVDARGALRRTLTFVITLGALLGFSHSGQRAVVVWAVYAVFVSVATVWLRGQYADSLDGRQWVIPYWVGAVLIGVAVVLLVSCFVPWPHGVDKGLLAISAVVLIYLVAGSALTQARQSSSIRVLGREIRTRRCGTHLTCTGLALAVTGAVLLGQLGWVVAGALLIAVGACGLIPVGMALWSEQSIRWVCAQDRAAVWSWGLGVGGAVLFAAATAGAVWAAHSAWLTFVLVVLGLFVFAMVSTTQADIVAVMAAVALMGVTPAQLSKQETPNPDGGRHVLVALGDSYMSGEGAAVYYDRTDDGGFAHNQDGRRNECRRAPTAWAARVTQNPEPFDGLKFLACAGARADQVIGQVEDYRRTKSYDPSMVVLSLGGNDVGFASLGVMCLAPGKCNENRGIWWRSLGSLPNELRRAYDQVDEAFKKTPVVVVPYPDPLKITKTQCGQVALSWEEQAFIHEFVTELNSIIHQVAREYGFYYLGQMQSALRDSHLQLCDELNDGRPRVNFIGLRSVRGEAMQRFNPAKWVHSSLHPNERGHAAMARAFQSWLGTREAKLPARDSVNELPRVGATAAPPDTPPCDLLGKTDVNDCETMVRWWTARQFGKVLLRRGLCLMIAGAAGGAWCVGVAFFAYRRRVHARCG